RMPNASLASVCASDSVRDFTERKARLSFSTSGISRLNCRTAKHVVVSGIKGLRSRNSALASAALHDDPGKAPALPKDPSSSTVPGVVRYGGIRVSMVSPHPDPLPVGEGTASGPIANHQAGSILHRTVNVSPSPRGRGLG